MDTVITGTNQEIRTALDDVNLPNLLLVLATVTGDEVWLSEKYRPAAVEAPEGSLFPDDTGRYPEALQEDIKTAAVEILAAIRDGQRELGPAPDQDQLQHTPNYTYP